MGFTDLPSRLPSGKALPTSYYDQEFVVGVIDKIQNILFKRTQFNSVDENNVDIDRRSLQILILPSIVISRRE